jgi:hypothetical protein
MNEAPTTPPRAIAESPVPDPTLFLLNDMNRAYLEGKTVRPQIADASTSNGRGWQWIVGGAVVYILLTVCGGFDAIAARMPDIRLPDLPDFPIQSANGMFLFLGVLLLLGVLVVFRDMMEARRRTGAEATPSVPPSEKPVAVVASRPKGQVLEGTVVQAEKIVTREQYGHVEKIGVRYQFAAPGGVITVGYAAGLSGDASHPMAPVPGTPVRIYYRENGKHYLL